MNNPHCFYCSSRPLKTICPLQGVEYLTKSAKTTEDKFIQSCLKETLIRHLQNAPCNYICQGVEKCSNLTQMLTKVLQEKEQIKDLTYRWLHLLNEVKSLSELENKLPTNLIKGNQSKQGKIKVSSDCFIEFICENNQVYEIDIINQQGQTPLWLEWVVEAEKEVQHD